MASTMPKKIQVSFVIRDEEERRHKNGVSSLQLDPSQGRLYSAGRDGIIRVWNTAPGLQDRYVQNMEHHADWVNDIILCSSGRYLISASSDTTVKVWNAHKGFCMSTLRIHKDYVRALAYAKDKEQVASGGMDRQIFLWDVNRLTALTACNNTVPTNGLVNNKDSIYSLAMNPSGTILIMGSTEKVLRVWDPRNCSKLMKLKGHADNVKALVMSRDGTQCVSGSSDGTIKLWLLSQKQCVSTISVHSDSVWALLATENFTHIISGGRDKWVIITELRNPDNFMIVCQETAPILKLCFTEDQEGVWVSTSESDIRCWKLPQLSAPETIDLKDVFQTSAQITIPGGPVIKQYSVLNDKQNILIKDTEDNVALYNVLKAEKNEDLGVVDFDEEVKKRCKMVYVPNWFRVELKTGMLMITLGQDGTDCLSAWAIAKEAGLDTEDDDQVNFGVLLLQALLEHWRHLNRDKMEQEGIGNKYFSVPLHTPLIFTEIGGRTVHRLQVGEASSETESKMLSEIVPPWVESVVTGTATPPLKKLSFHLVAADCLQCQYGRDRQKKDLLTAKDFVHCRVVGEHVLRLLGEQLAARAPVRAADEVPPRVELICCGQVLDPNMDLRTVRHFIWNSDKSDAQFTLYYRVKH